MRGDEGRATEAELRRGVQLVIEASVVGVGSERAKLLHDARTQFSSAVAKDHGLLPHALATTLLAETWVLLDERELARAATCQAALVVDETWDLYERKLSEADWPLPIGRYRPVRELEATKALAGDVVDLCLALDVDLAAVRPGDDDDDGWYLMHLDQDFVHGRRFGTRAS